MPTLDEIDARVRADRAQTTKVPLSLQIAEVERELALRANVYPRMARQGKMRMSEAEEHMRRMRAVLDTLRSMQG